MLENFIKNFIVKAVHQSNLQTSIYFFTFLSNIFRFQSMHTFCCFIFIMMHEYVTNQYCNNQMNLADIHKFLNTAPGSAQVSNKLSVQQFDWQITTDRIKPDGKKLGCRNHITTCHSSKTHKGLWTDRWRRECQVQIVTRLTYR